MEVGIVDALLFLHQALAPSGRASEELLPVSALFGVVVLVCYEEALAFFSGLGDEVYEFFGHAF